jgi:hypothetical protein
VYNRAHSGCNFLGFVLKTVLWKQFVKTICKNIKLDKNDSTFAFCIEISADLFGSLELTLSAQQSFENL